MLNRHWEISYLWYPNASCYKILTKCLKLNKIHAEKKCLLRLHPLTDAQRAIKLQLAKIVLKTELHKLHEKKIFLGSWQLTRLRCTFLSPNATLIINSGLKVNVRQLMLCAQGPLTSDLYTFLFPTAMLFKFQLQMVNILWLRGYLGFFYMTTPRFTKPKYPKKFWKKKTSFSFYLSNCLNPLIWVQSLILLTVPKTPKKFSRETLQQQKCSWIRLGLR